MSFEELVKLHLDREPRIAPDAYVSSRAYLVGDVEIGPRASIWPFASLRADIAPIKVGACSNVQDNCTVHVATRLGVSIGDWVTVGHGATVHACTIEDGCLIGMNATVLDGAIVGAGSLIGAHALVTGGMLIPPGSMVLGTPAKIVRALTPEEISGLRVWGDHYLTLSAEYRSRQI